MNAVACCDRPRGKTLGDRAWDMQRSAQSAGFPALTGGTMLSQLALSIKESPTLKLNEMAALLRDKGEPVIHLGGGEPKSRTPIDAIISCSSILNTGEVRYTPADGIPALRKAVTRYTEEHYDRAHKP